MFKIKLIGPEKISDFRVFASRGFAEQYLPGRPELEHLT
jgi:hypothetical protein